MVKKKTEKEKQDKFRENKKHRKSKIQWLSSSKIFQASVRSKTELCSLDWKEDWQVFASEE